MSKPPTPDKPIRTSLTLLQSLWDQVEEYRAAEGILTTADAVRRLLADALKAWRQKVRRGQ